MADDIDIEEHDVLDNPRIKNIFPDLVRIKTEPPDVDDQDDTMDFENAGFNNHIESFRDALRFEEPVAEDPRYSNKRILGTKHSTGNKTNPASTSSLNIQPEEPPLQGNLAQTIKPEPLSDDDDANDDMEPLVFGNPTPVLIVGSKPTPEMCDSTVVLLEDWGPRLERSSCYCQDCRILFPTRNCMDFHKASVHSFLVAVDTNRAVKSTAKSAHLMNTRKSAGPAKEPGASKTELCNHCNKTFVDDTALIKHLYEVVPFEVKCSKCDAVFKTEAELQAHAETHNRVPTSTEFGNYYRCNVCSCYFRHKCRYVRHMSRNHGQKESDFHFKLPFVGQCPFCRYIGDNKKYYNRHVTQVHLKLYLDKGSSAKAAPTEPPLEAAKVKFQQNKLKPSKALQKTVTRIVYKYQCTQCYEIYPSYYLARRHKRSKHAEFKNLSLYKKIAVRKIVPLTHGNKLPKPPVKRPEIKAKSVNEELANPPIPKDVLFKCVHCQIHFTNCSAAVVHSRNCLKYKGDWKCQECKRTFKFKDRAIHQQQHQVSESFNVYLVDDETVYGRVLCQCPHCDLYFHENEFWSHFKLGCRPTKPFHCKTCNLPIHVSSLNEHNKYHRNPEVASDESILIQFFVNPNTDDATAAAKTSKRRITDETDETPSKKPKLQNDKGTADMTMYYCIHCKCCCSFGSRYITYHNKGLCKNTTKVGRICKLCGLLIASQTHKQKHAAHGGMKISDFKFVRIQDNKIINAPMPEYPRCHKCDVHFINPGASQCHDCGDNSKTCRYCKRKFSDLAYKLHVPFHEYRAPTFNSTPEQRGGETSSTPKKLAVPQKVATPQKAQAIDRELLKKYLLLTNTWNMLYLCQICDIVCDSYDKMVEHSQNHFSKMESYDMTVFLCPICNLKFDSTCFEKHMELHLTNKSINKESFDIFTYNYMHLLTDDWYKLFGDLPKTQIDRIESQSMYNYTRAVKMRVVKDGPPEYTLYQCAQCEKHVNPPTLVHHYKYASCSRDARKFQCSICDIHFASVSARNHHALAHKAKHETFRTVLINENGDEQFNLAMRTDSHKERAVPPVQKATGLSKRQYVYYQCSGCECCIKLADKMKAHRCNEKLPKKPCLRCGLQFVRTQLSKHKELHQILPGFERKNMKIIRFDPPQASPQTDSLSGDKVGKIYKCQCGLHFISSKAVYKHLAMCIPNHMISKENCSQCGLLFPTDALVSHLCSHHSHTKYSRFEVEEVTSGQKVSAENNTPNMDNIKGVFKCTKCDLYFLSMSSLRHHFKSNHAHVNKNTITCNLCGLKFLTASIKRHIDYHHTKLKCQLKDIRISAFNADFNKKDDRKRPQYKLSKTFLSKLNLKLYGKNLYKCLSCAVHFLTKQSLNSHQYTAQHRVTDTSTSTECDICGLAFLYQSLPRHKYVHHDKLKLSRKHFRIITRFDKTDKTKAVKEDVVSEVRTSTQDTTLDDHQNSESDIAGLDADGDVQMIQSQHADLNKDAYYHRTKLKCQQKDVTAFDADFKKVDDRKRPQYKLSKKFLSKLNLKLYGKNLYKCLSCAVHFLTKQSLNSHQYTEQHRVTDTSTSTECDICGLAFLYQSLPRHKYIHHDKLKLSRKHFRITSPFHRTYNRKDATEDVVPEVRTSARDTTLDDRQDSESDISRLDADEDVEMTQSQHAEFNKDVYNKKSAVDERIKTNASHKTDNWLERVLYRCEKCPINFLTLNGLDNHKAKRQHGLPKRECDTCHLMFTAQSLYKHQDIQHEKLALRLEDLLIVSRKRSSRNLTAIDTLIYSECLYKCVKCSIHLLTRRTFNDHVADCDGEAKKTQCIVCDLVFSEDTISTHFKIHHEILKLQNEEFDIVKQAATEEDLLILDTDNALKDTTVATERTNENSEESINTNDNEDENTMEIDETIPSKSSVNILNERAEKSASVLSFKPIYGNNLFKCRICSVHFMSGSSLSNHIALNKHSSPKTNCSYCRLDFCNATLTRHKEIHHLKMKLSLEDFKIIEGSSEGEAAVVNNILYKCTVCHLHFVSESARDDHTCEPDVDFDIANKGRCKKCDISFHSSALRRHRYLHHEKMNLKSEDLVIVTPRKDMKETPVPKDYYSTELEKPKLPEKSKPTKDVEKSKWTTYHLSQKQKSSINILLYNEYLYLCTKCNLHYLSANVLRRHCCSRFGKTPVSKVKCTSCGLWFSAQSLARHDYIHHQKLGLKFENFRILNETEIRASISNASVDDASIDNMEVDDSSSINTQNNEDEIDTANTFTADTLIDESNEPSPTKSKKLRSYTLPAAFKAQVKLSLFSDTLYKCNVCLMHYLDTMSLDKHISSCDGSIKNIKNCAVCGLSFSFITVEKHMYIHHVRLQLKREDMKVVSIIKSSASQKHKKAKGIVKTYCSGSKNIGTTNTIEQVISKSSANEVGVVSQDITVLESETPVSESTVLQSETDDLTMSIDSDDDAAEISASTSNKLPLPKLLLYLSKSGEDNSSNKNTTIPKVVISESTSSDDVEMSIDELNSSKESIEIDATRKTKYKTKLYRCGECKVYFMTQATCYKHTIKHKSLHNLEFIDCKVCGLPFRVISLHKHMSAHHKKEFKLEDVLVEEYHPHAKRNGMPNIEIYYAIDKVQSKQVSTTTEVSGKEIDSAEVDQSNIKVEIVTNVPHASSSEGVSNSEEISKSSNTHTNPESAVSCHYDNKENTDKRPTIINVNPENAIAMDVPEQRPTEKVNDLGINESMTNAKRKEKVDDTVQDIDTLEVTGLEVNGPTSTVNRDTEKIID